jgi:ABC-type antimicrobial peptide transport system permease subunit
VIACSVSRRTREIGIRLALGASRRSVAGLAMVQAFAVVGAGLVLGGLAALAAGRVLRRMLVGVGPADPLTFAAAFVLLTGITAIASGLPAFRASRMNPIVALRQE